MRRRALLAAAVVGPSAAVLGACSTSPEPVVVLVRDLRFTPQTVTVAVGGTVEWRFDDEGMYHHVLADDGSFDSDIVSSGTFVVTFDIAGTHPYTCSVHPYMTGTVLVR